MLLQRKIRFCLPATLLLIVVYSPARAQDELPQLEDMQLPSAQDLLQAELDAAEYDWVVLKNDSVIVAEPVYPRPNTLQKIADEKQELERQRPRNAQERNRRKLRLEQLRNLDIVLPENSADDYKLPIGQVKDVIIFEQLMLRRIDTLLQQGDITTAYEMLLIVERRIPNWTESVPRFEALLLREAELKLQDGDRYAALALLEELAGRNLKNERLPEVMGQTFESLITEAVNAKAYRKAESLIARLLRYFPEHSVAKGWQERLIGEMRRLLQQAAELSEQDQHVKAAEIAQQAHAVWQRKEGAERALYSRIVSRHQKLRIPTRTFFDQPNVMPITLAAERRHQELTTVNLFEATGADDLTYFESSFFELWDPQDLGREVLFTMRRARPYWQSQPLLTSNQVAETLSGMLNPNLETFDPRIASFIDRFSVRSPTQLQVSFRRVPMSLEAMFRFPIRDASGKVVSERFQLVESAADRRIYRRSIPEPDGLTPTQYHVAEVQEVLYPDRKSEIQAFNRKQLDILPQLLPWEVDIFRNSGRATVLQYALPENHLIVFNPMSEAVRNPQLRRGLSFGIDRINLLKRIALRDEEMKYGRIASAPWHSNSYASDPLMTDPTYDHYLSFLLRFAALEQKRIPPRQKIIAEAKTAYEKSRSAEDPAWDEVIYRQNNADALARAVQDIQLPVLRMVVEPGDLNREIAEKMAERWRALQYKIEIIDGGKDGEKLQDTDWDLMYRTATVEEPLLDLWELLLTDDKFDVSRLVGFPDWMRQELINLDYATSFVEAQERLFKIHRHMEAQAFLIPMFEVDRFMALQPNIAEYQGRPLSLYHGVEKWLVKP